MGEVADKEDSFLLVRQTKHQQNLLRKYGNTVTLMDGVYTTPQNMVISIVKTSLGMSRVVGTIIPQQKKMKFF